MTGDVVNLRQFRKQKTRANDEKTAEQNRITFGRSKSEKTLTKALNETAERRLDQGRRETPSQTGEDKDGQDKD
ncbi:uncharacterized protein DUF4169 [Rhizobium sp. PP-F2F-G38]|nr:uncharacterized protein DUF4169 [Rhizobium sp. PP-WC-1G-195]PYF00816.1 uncharacterized protein DUF4169 [Rhizobium sp. PP-F2F-G38]TCQ10057.1 uncharacterized protein DUF4169 [Rhizobium sp. PP-F2F-G36]